MVRIKLTLAYDGTAFRGWMAQAGKRTVQQTLTDAIAQVCGEQIEIVGASRTDSGAHARGQVCHFDSAVGIDPRKWPEILNRILPLDLAVTRSSRVGPDFNSRFCAEDRFYRYRIRTSARDPLISRYVHDHGKSLNLDLMRLAAESLLGDHDFRSFTENLDPSVRNTRRTLRRIKVQTHGPEIRIDVVGTAFLRGMMRRISGALLEVGSGKRPLEEIGLLLAGKADPKRLPVVLPAKGLCLMRVRYANPPVDHRRDSEVESASID